MDGETMETDSNQEIVKEKEKEPLFIEDRTHNFKLGHAIKYHSKSDDANNSPKSNVGYKQNACWNCCSTNHSLHNCHEPRNPRMISQNRQAFMMQKHMQQQQQYFKYKFGGRKNVRYFVDETHDLCSRFTPGKLSDDLLKVLGVPKNGIPLHIYKMRKYGYPGGWLEEAREEFSGISIFTAPNECLPFPGKEKGDNNVHYCSLNEKKLHQYPGFNAPCPPDTIDEYEKIGCPKYSPDQNVKSMYKRLKTNNFDTKEISESNSKQEQAPVTTQSVLDEKNEVLEDESKISIPDQKENSIDEKEMSSVEDGEITEDENVEPLSDEAKDVVPNELVDEEDNSEMCVDTNESMQDKTLSVSLKSNGSVSTPTNSKRNFGDVKSEILGTPVIKHCSPYENRPAHEHFAKGMVEMVDHENLPNAIGTFQKLKNILSDVRKTMNNLL